MGVVFDKLGFMRKLEGGDFTRAQAETLTEAFYDAVVESVATKQDVAEVRVDLKQDITEPRAEFKLNVAELRAELAQVKIWVAGTAVVVVSGLSALKFFQ